MVDPTPVPVQNVTSFDDLTDDFSEVTSPPPSDFVDGVLDIGNALAEPQVTPFEDIVTTPYDVKEDRGKYDRLGVAPDKLPVINAQAVDSTQRFITEFLFDTPEEKAGYLKSVLGDGFYFAKAPHDSSKVILRPKSETVWGVVDPSKFTLEEGMHELTENIDIIAQTLGVSAGLLGSTLTTGGIQGVRQLIKNQVLPKSEFRGDKVLIDSASGFLGAGGSKLMKEVAKGATKQARQGVGNLIDDATNPGGVLNKLGQKINVLDDPETIAKEIATSAKQLDPTQKNILVNKVGKLQKEYPEFMEAYRSAYTLKGKFQATNELLESAGARIGKTQIDESIEIPVKDILASASYQDLLKASKTRVVNQGKRLGVKVNSKAAEKIADVRRDFLEDIGTTTIGTTPWGKKQMQAFAKNKLHLTPKMKELGIKNNEEALLYLIKDQSMSLPEAVMTRMGRDGLVNYNKSAGQIKALNSVDKYTADALREVIEKTALEKMPNGQQFVRDLELFHNLHPVVKNMGSKLGQETFARWDPIGKTLPGFINSAPRFVAKLGVNLSNKTEVRTFLANLSQNQGFKLPAGSKLGKGLNFASRLKRAATFHTSKGILDKALGEEAAAEGLPRDVDAYFKNPQLFNTLTETMGSTEETDQAVRMLERGDREGFANALSMFSSQNEDTFATAPYKSLVMNGNTPVIQDKYDREQYRQWINKTITDPKEKYRYLKALNMNNEMLKAPYEIPAPNLNDNIKLGKSTSTVSRVASQLKQVDTVELDDGTERTAYDY